MKAGGTAELCEIVWKFQFKMNFPDTFKFLQSEECCLITAFSTSRSLFFICSSPREIEENKKLRLLHFYVNKFSEFFSCWKSFS